MTLLWTKIGVFQKRSLMKHSGFNRTLIVMDFKFTAEILGQTEGGEKRDNKGQFALIYRLV